MSEMISVIIFRGAEMDINDQKDIQASKIVEYKLIPDEVQTYYDIIGCDTVEFVIKQIGGKKYRVICDEMARYKSGLIITMANPKNTNDIIIGTVVIAGMEKRGDLTSLTNEDIKNISNHLGYMVGKKEGREIVCPVILTE